LQNSTLSTSLDTSLLNTNGVSGSSSVVVIGVVTVDAGGFFGFGFGMKNVETAALVLLTLLKRSSGSIGAVSDLCLLLSAIELIVASVNGPSPRVVVFRGQQMWWDLFGAL